MAFYKVLDTTFIHSLEEGEESLSLILGQTPRDLLECRLADKSQWDDSYFYVFSSAMAAAPQELISDFLNSPLRVMGDEGGDICAIKLGKDDLRPSEGQLFEEFVVQLTKKEFPSWMSEVDVFDFLSINSMSALSRAEEDMAFVICDYWRQHGVRIDDESTHIGYKVKIGLGTHIEGQTTLSGDTVIGKNCLITSGSRISNSRIGDGVRIRSSVIEDSEMEEGSNIGPFSHLRPGAHLAKGVHIGNFVEVKKASLGEGTKAGHLAYIGDADVGADVNISCGVIFCNYDGKNKHHTRVGDHAFLGSNANLVAPLEVEEDGFVAAGSTITRKVEKGELALERTKQRNIPGYVEEKKKRGEL